MIIVKKQTKNNIFIASKCWSLANRLTSPEMNETLVSSEDKSVFIAANLFGDIETRGISKICQHKNIFITDHLFLRVTPAAACKKCGGFCENCWPAQTGPTCRTSCPIVSFQLISCPISQSFHVEILFL